MNPTSRPDAEKAQFANHEAALPAAEVLTPESQRDVTVLAKMLAAVGGGEVSQGLALDLVLNGVVEQARKDMRASGAAIALLRDGQMICRATMGNAPDLGVRVETETGISGACLITGNVQLCSDTDVDPRVNAEVCRRLNVRSMLMAPISDGKQNLGIVEVFAAEPNAFKEEDVKTLQTLAQRVADSKKASEETPKASEESAKKSESEAPSPVAKVRDSEPSTAIPEEANRREFFTSVLVVLVIAVAIVLGVVIGVGVTKRNAGRASGTNAAIPASSASASPQTSPQQASATSADAGPSSTPDSAAASAAALEPPIGGLIVTQNGKVVYRSDVPGGENPSKSGNSSGRLLHRVDPIYPAEAQAQHIEGSVILNVHVSGEGSVGEVEILSGPPLLAQAATQAVKQWKYQRYYVNGQPVDRQERITVRFSLSKS